MERQVSHCPPITIHLLPRLSLHANGVGGAGSVWGVATTSTEWGSRRSEVGGDIDTRLTLMDNLSLTTALEIYCGGVG